VKFAADCMLGTLAKWLILLGHDVAYFPRIEDGELVRVARREGRTILTCDRRLVQRRDAKDHILIGSQNLAAQVRQVMEERRLRIRKDRLFRRCVKCNRATRPVSRPSVRLEVPPYVYRKHRRFTRCPRCRRIFWRATHVDRMLENLKETIGRPPGGALRRG
jgi:uncharacterized protein with PIN domain